MMDLKTGIIAAAGDIGGANAMLPVLCELRRRNIGFALADHGAISGKADESWIKISEDAARRSISSGKTKVFFFTTSMKDPFPLELARSARKKGSKTICLLDNWMNYRLRMETDGGPFLIPALFLVMDEFAKEESVKAGFPENKVIVTGQPALASVSLEYEEWKKLGHGTESGGKKRIVFISEPVESDQGKSAGENPNFRGYTEKTVLRLLFRAMAPHRSEFILNVIPHPREDSAALEKFWDSNAKEIDGAVVLNVRGRTAIFGSDAVAGMCSILLYEASLLGKPVISIQPNLTAQYSPLSKKGLLSITGNEKEAEHEVSDWISGLSKSPALSNAHELKQHLMAAGKIADIIQNHLG